MVTSPENFQDIVPRWMTAAASTTLATNIYCVCKLQHRLLSENFDMIPFEVFISLKLNKAHRKMRFLTPAYDSVAKRVMAVVIESAAIYLATVLAFLVLTVTRSNVQFIILSAVR
jgi:hypothetical protein